MRNTLNFSRVRRKTNKSPRVNRDELTAMLPWDSSHSESEVFVAADENIGTILVLGHVSQECVAHLETRGTIQQHAVGDMNPDRAMFSVWTVFG